jgi:hypothetical protein
MRGHMIEVELLTLGPKIFDNLQDLFTKYKDLLSQLKACRVEKTKEEKQMVLTILSNLGLEYSLFVFFLGTPSLTIMSKSKSGPNLTKVSSKLG